MPNAQDTNKMSKVTDEMLENFAEPKTEQEPDKTIVEFNEDADARQRSLGSKRRNKDMK